MAFCTYCGREVALLCGRCGRKKGGLKCNACGSFAYGACAQCKKTIIPKGE